MTAAPAKPAFNPWPYALVAFFAVFVSCVVAFGVWAVRQKVELVGSDYYEQEVRFQRQIDSEARAQAGGTAAAIDYRPGTREITLHLPAGTFAGGATGRIHLYRPSDAALDRELPLAVDAEGRQAIGARDLRDGPWKVRIHWTASGVEYAAVSTVVVAAPAP